MTYVVSMSAGLSSMLIFVRWWYVNVYLLLYGISVHVPDSCCNAFGTGVIRVDMCL